MQPTDRGQSVEEVEASSHDGTRCRPNGLYDQIMKTAALVLPAAAPATPWPPSPTPRCQGGHQSPSRERERLSACSSRSPLVGTKTTAPGPSVTSPSSPRPCSPASASPNCSAWTSAPSTAGRANGVSAGQGLQGALRTCRGTSRGHRLRLPQVPQGPLPGREGRPRLSPLRRPPRRAPPPRWRPVPGRPGLPHRRRWGPGEPDLPGA